MDVQQAAFTSFSSLQASLAARLFQVPVGPVEVLSATPPLSASECFPKTEQQIAAYHTVTNTTAELGGAATFGAHSAASALSIQPTRFTAAQLLSLGLGTPEAYPFRHANQPGSNLLSARDAPRLSPSRVA
jgi:hypothetical protein